jgi:hypothetical protein
MARTFPKNSAAAHAYALRAGWLILRYLRWMKPIEARFVTILPVHRQAAEP